MNHHIRFAGVGRVAACLTGSGAFGRSFLAQARRIPRLDARVALDLTAQAAGEALASAGWPRADIALCETTQEARAAWAAGRAVAAGRLDAVLDLPFDILVEATGHPEAGAAHALAAIEARRHVVLVTKETDSVVGPMLARLARAAGVCVTPVDGDQPSLLIDLVTWAQTMGFDIVCAGKSSEYDFVVDPASGRVLCDGVAADLPALAAWWSAQGRPLPDVVAGRAAALGAKFPLRAVPDLCELTLVGNACGLSPDRPDFHAPAARVPELPRLFCDRAPHGLLAGAGRLDVFHHLRAPDEASFAGGVFVVVRCDHEESWRTLAGKGHVVDLETGTAALYLPRHLLGLEAATSILDAVGRGVSAYPDDYAPRLDLVAVATRDLPAGALLEARGHHHTIDGVAAQMRPARALSRAATTPYYLVANRRLARAVRAGEAIAPGDVVLDEASVLAGLRARQDAAFAEGGETR